MAIFYYGKDTLSVEIAIGILKGKIKTAILDETVEKIKACRAVVEEVAQEKKPVYGVNTGFGPLCDTSISPEETSLLQKKLLLSHAVGVGLPIKKELSMLMLICKVHALCKAYSGIRLSVIQRIIDFIDQDIIPVVPEQGSVGASGDLAPLSHLFLPLIGEGHFWKEDKQIPTNQVYKDLGLEPIELSAKEGLALINGTQFILAHAIMGLDHMKYMLDLVDLAAAMSLEGFQGSASPFKEKLHLVRPFEGSLLVAKRMRHFLEGSENRDSHKDCGRVQDPYSLRCSPQVHGASRNAYKHLLELTEIEMNSITDNPVVFNHDEIISGGNFHGQLLAMAIDYGTLACAELGNISDRRCYLLLEGKYGLPRLLTKSGGLDSGFMIPQYTTAALVSENKTLCYPASADSIPTSLGQEDHVSMGSISGRKFNLVLTNLNKIIAIELMYAAQAMDFRRPLRFSNILEQNHKIIRERVDHLENDRLLKKDIDQMVHLVKERAFIVNQHNEII